MEIVYSSGAIGQFGNMKLELSKMICTNLSDIECIYQQQPLRIIVRRVVSVCRPNLVRYMNVAQH